MELLSISCYNTYAPLGYDIPSVSGELVTASSGYYCYSGDFTRAKLEVIPETEKNIADAEVIFPSIYSNSLEIRTLYYEGKKYTWTETISAGVNMPYDKISVVAPYTTIKNAPYYKYVDYDTGIVYNARVDNGNVKSYIKVISLSFAEYIVAMTTNGMSIRATYTAILEDNSPIE